MCEIVRCPIVVAGRPKSHLSHFRLCLTSSFAPNMFLGERSPGTGRGRTKAAERSTQENQREKLRRVGPAIGNYALQRNRNAPDEKDGGHQQKAALERDHGAALKIKSGALITPAGERFPIRVVDWPPDKAQAARVVANSGYLTGDWSDNITEVLANLERTLGPQFLNLRLDELQAETEQAVSRVRQLDLIQRPIETVWLLIGVPAGQAAAVLPHLDEITKIDGVLCETTIR